MSSRRILLHILTLTALTAATALALAVPAVAKSYSDVPKSHWAYSAISSVTNRAVDGHRLLDDYRSLFRPETPDHERAPRALHRPRLRPLRREDHACRDRRRPDGLPLLLGHPDGRARRATWSLDKDGAFRPTENVTAAAAETVMIRWLKERYASYDWSLLTTLDPSRWEPNAGWTTGAPSYLPYIVASRQLELRYNHPTGGDDHEVLPTEPIDRAEIAYMLDRAFKVGEQLAALRPRRLRGHHLPGPERPAEADRQVRAQVRRLPLHLGRRVPDSRTRRTARRSAGGFDCSGFVFYVMRMHFGYPASRSTSAGPTTWPPRQAARHPREAQVRRPHLLRAQGPQVERRVDLPRRAVPGPRLVHPLDRLERRRDPGVAQRLQLLEGGVRVGPPRAHGRRSSLIPSPSPSPSPSGRLRPAALSVEPGADAGGVRGVAHRHRDAGCFAGLGTALTHSAGRGVRASLSPPTVALPLLSAPPLHCAA